MSSIRAFLVLAKSNGRPMSAQQKAAAKREAARLERLAAKLKTARVLP